MYEQFYAAQTNEERKTLAERIKIRREELKEAEKYLDDAEGVYMDFLGAIMSMNNRELRDHIKKLKKEMLMNMLTS